MCKNVKRGALPRERRKTKEKQRKERDEAESKK